MTGHRRPRRGVRTDIPWTPPAGFTHDQALDAVLTHLTDDRNDR